MEKIQGAVHKIRKMSEFSFVIIRTRRDLIQCIYDEEQNSKLELKEGFWVEIEGQKIENTSQALGYEIKIETVNVVSEPEEQMPLTINKKTVNELLNTKLDYRAISLRHHKERAVFKIQEGIKRGFRDFFHSQNFTEITTPKIVAGSAEGGANVFKLDYFDQKVFLAQSPQFYKQMLVGVYERVFEVGPVFRAEKHNTSRHMNEYTSLDIEMGFIKSFEDVMKTEEEMLKYVIKLLENEYKDELNILEIELPKITTIPVVKFSEIKKVVSEKYNRPIVDEKDLEPEEERLICKYIKETTDSDFVFVTHYPTSKRPFYAMEDPENNEETLSFDLLFKGEEITTGGQRIHNYRMQVEKMERLRMSVSDFEGYLMAHKYGLPPHGGFGIGLERLTARLLGLENIREATTFPRDTKRVTP